MKAFAAFAVCAVLTLGVAVGQTPKGEPPAQRELFAKEAWYKDQNGKELEYIGVLSRVDAKGGAGIGRFNPYRLTISETVFVTESFNQGGKVVTKAVPVISRSDREVYVGGQGNLLDPYVGKSVKLIGKAVKMEVVGQIHSEIWPARLVVMSAPADPNQKQKVEAGKQLPVLAHAAWPGAIADPKAVKKAEQFVVRDSMDLVNHHPWNLLDALPQAVAASASTQLAKILGVEKIDWTKQMLIVLTAGYKATSGNRVEIAALTVTDGKLTVQWRDVPAEGVINRTPSNASKLLLVDRMDGPVSFVKATATKKTDGPQVAPIPLINPVPVQPKIRPLPGPVQGPVPLIRPLPIKAQQLRVAEQDGKDPKVIAQTKSRLVGGQGGHLVIRTEEELLKAAGGKGQAADILARLAKQLKVESIDLKKHMVVVVSGGTQRTGGYSVDIKGVKVDGKTLTVEWKLNTPPPGSIVTQALTNPAATALVERFEGDVRFNPATAPGGVKGLRPID